jgi:hypothetical protein
MAKVHSISLLADLSTCCIIYDTKLSIVCAAICWASLGGRITRGEREACEKEGTFDQLLGQPIDVQHHFRYHAAGQIS